MEPISKHIVQGSRRSQQTDSPVIVKTKKLMAGTEGAVSLAQGVLLNLRGHCYS